MPTREAVTAHGEVTYETVECDSCGHELPKEEARDIVVGDLQGVDRWAHMGDEFEFKNYRRGYVCQFCEDDPAGFPGASFVDMFTDLHFAAQFAAVVTVGLLLLVIVMAVVA